MNFGSLIEYEFATPVEITAKTSEELLGVTGVWSLKESSTDNYHSYMVIAFIHQTRILQYSGIIIIISKLEIMK